MGLEKHSAGGIVARRKFHTKSPHRRWHLLFYLGGGVRDALAHLLGGKAQSRHRTPTACWFGGTAVRSGDINEP